MKDGDLFNESMCPDGVGQRFRISRVLYQINTEFQHLMIFENPVLGKMMAIDGVIQTTTGDEFVYHEMLAHLPILAHGEAKRVLIIGGGDGGMLRRCLEHKTVEKVVMVEIDRTVIDVALKWMPEIAAGAFDDPRAELINKDGCKYVKETQEKFDVIIIDSTDPTDPDGPGSVLFTSEFYGDCKKCLTPGGVLVMQNGVPPFYLPEGLVNTYRRIKPLFKDAGFFVAAVPTYYSGLTAFGWATDNTALRHEPLEVIKKRFAKSGVQKTQYYTPEIHLACFALPQHMLNTLATV